MRPPRGWWPDRSTSSSRWRASSTSTRSARGSGRRSRRSAWRSHASQASWRARGFAPRRLPRWWRGSSASSTKPGLPRTSFRTSCRRSAVSTQELPGVPAAPLSYREAWALIEARGQAILPDLARVEALVELLDHPQATYPTLQIAGTNGKSSTARIIGAVLAAHGLTAGVYTSPHLQSIRERYLLTGPAEEAGILAEAIPPEEFAGLVQYLLPFVDLVERQTGERVTYFEFTTVLAFEWMATHSVEAGIYEAGLGGSWDATNVVPSSVAVLTHVAVDHAAMLGATPLDNAREKVGIIKPGASVVSVVQDPDVGDLVAATAADVGANLVVMDRDFHLRA